MKHAALRRAAAAALLAGLAACGAPSNRSTHAPRPLASRTAAVVAGHGGAATAGRAASPTPPLPTPSPVPSDSADAAVAVVRAYAAAIDRGDDAAAWAMWDHRGAASGLSRAAFSTSIARFARYRVQVGPPGRIEPGAGQRYITIPLEASGTLKEGDRPFAARGTATLHRVANIDGASAEVRRWHLHSFDVPDPAEGSAPPAAVARYRCTDGSTLTVRFDNRADTATITRGGKTLGVLGGQRPASGIWYRSEQLELRGKGRDATFSEYSRPPLACRARA